MSNIDLIKHKLLKTLDFNPNDAGPDGLILMGQAVLLQKLNSLGFGMVQDVQDFHNMLGLQPFEKHKNLPDDVQKFRDGILREEFNEYLEAVKAKDREAQLDGLVDLIYVAIGTMLVHGWDAEEAWRRIHAANMKKQPGEPGEGKTIAMKTGQVDAIKPQGWKHPSLKDLV